MPNIIILVSALLNILLLVLVFYLRHKHTKYVNSQCEQEKLRESFTAMIIHELRSPLSVIQGSADLLIMEVKNLNPEQIYNTLNQIKTSSHDLLGVVNDLLDLAKIETGKIELFLKKQSLHKLLSEEYSYYLTHAKDRGVNIILDADETTPETEFDYDKIKQVLNNLISNALKFTDPGESIFLYLKKKDGEAEVTVADTGKGVPEEKKHLLFSKFIQIQSTLHKKDKSTGLGLAISKGIIDAHKGKIWYEPNLPKGSKFIFTLPLTS